MSFSINCLCEIIFVITQIMVHCRECLTYVAACHWISSPIISCILLPFDILDKKIPKGKAWFHNWKFKKHFQLCPCPSPEQWSPMWHIQGLLYKLNRLNYLPLQNQCAQPKQPIVKLDNGIPILLMLETGPKRVKYARYTIPRRAHSLIQTYWLAYAPSFFLLGFSSTKVWLLSRNPQSILWIKRDISRNLVS